MEHQHDRQHGGSEPTAESDADRSRAGHEESLAAIHDLARQVEDAEAAEGGAVPSQADADETAATGI